MTAGHTPRTLLSSQFSINGQRARIVRPISFYSQRLTRLIASHRIVSAAPQADDHGNILTYGHIHTYRLHAKSLTT